jgi:hypothetical protein
MRVTMLIAVLLALPFTVAAQEEVSEFNVAQINESQVEMQCQMDPGDIEVS